MIQQNETWTTTHDLALVFIALAYGTDNRLADAELDAITERLSGWRPGADRNAVHEVVVEAVSVYLEAPSEEVTRAVKRLGRELTEPERRRVLEEVVTIAEADGVLLASERGLIATLASAWEMKSLGDDLLAQTTVATEERPHWSLLHDVALVYVVLAHGTDGDLSGSEIDAIIRRLHDWQPELSEDDLRRVIGDVVTYYGTGLDRQALVQPVHNLREALPMMQRLAVLDDLRFIAEIDGPLVQEEQEMLRSIAQGLRVGIGLDHEA